MKSMRLWSESRKETTSPMSWSSNKILNVGTWNVRTMYETKNNPCSKGTIGLQHHNIRIV